MGALRDKMTFDVEISRSRDVAAWQTDWETCSNLSEDVRS
jgi:hypothetical protein